MGPPLRSFILFTKHRCHIPSFVWILNLGFWIFLSHFSSLALSHYVPSSLAPVPFLKKTENRITKGQKHGSSPTLFIFFTKHRCHIPSFVWILNLGFWIFLAHFSSFALSHYVPSSLAQTSPTCPNIIILLKYHTMNIILITRSDYIDDTNTIRITDRRFTHIKKIIRAEKGDVLKCGELGGLLGSAVVTDINEDHIDLNITLSEQPPEKLPVTVILALPRPLALKRILQSLTSLGVKKIFLIHAKRVEKSYWQSPVLSDSSINDQLILGLEQSRDTILPEIRLSRSFKRFVEDEMADAIAGTKALLAHPGPAGSFPNTSGKPVTIAIGPEGGFTEYEVEKLSGGGFETISLGVRILKTETAATAMVALYGVRP